jgi:hypothetical protein
MSEIMSEYIPDKWLIVKLTDTNKNVSHYRVFACWYGGYAGSDSWKMNSGITKVTENDSHFFFEGTSGSVYVCHKDAYGANGYGSSVLSRLIKNGIKDNLLIAPMGEDVNPMELDYS